MLGIRLKYRLLLIYRKFLLLIGLKKMLLKNRYGERILVFHGIDKAGETKYNSRFISRDFFEKFIKYISSHYNIISLDEYYQKKFKPNTLNIALTFDDGYLNNYKYAIPILKKYNIPASFYITTVHKKASYIFNDFIDIVSYHSPKNKLVFDEVTYKKNIKNEFVCNGSSLKEMAQKWPYKKIEELYELLKDDWNALSPKKKGDYWKLMSVEQLRELSQNPLFTIGAHGETHASLINISVKEAKEEIAHSKESLEMICGQTIDEFAFPFGHYNNELGNYCKEIGFTKVLLVDYNTYSDKKKSIYRSRFVMNPYISLDMQLIYLLKGTYY